MKGFLKSSFFLIFITFLQCINCSHSKPLFKREELKAHQIDIILAKNNNPINKIKFFQDLLRAMGKVSQNVSLLFHKKFLQEQELINQLLEAYNSAVIKSLETENFLLQHEENDSQNTVLDKEKEELITTVERFKNFHEKIFNFSPKSSSDKICTVNQTKELMKTKQIIVKQLLKNAFQSNLTEQEKIEDTLGWIVQNSKIKKTLISNFFNGCEWTHYRLQNPHLCFLALDSMRPLFYAFLSEQNSQSETIQRIDKERMALVSGLGSNSLHAIKKSVENSDLKTAQRIVEALVPESPLTLHLTKFTNEEECRKTLDGLYNLLVELKENPKTDVYTLIGWFSEVIYQESRTEDFNMCIDSALNRLKVRLPLTPERVSWLRKKQ